MGNDILDDEFRDPYAGPMKGPSPRPPRGCLFYGCLTLIVMMSLVVLGLFLAYRYFLGTVEEYTETSPRPMPKVEMPAEQVQALKQEVEDFRKAVEEPGDEPRRLVLTSDGLNALIADRDPRAADWVHLEIVGDRLTGEISIPLEELGFAPLRGRYLNGKATFHVSLRDGQFVVTIDTVEVKGRPLPEPVLSRLRRENLAENIKTDLETAEKLRNLDRLEIKDGTLILETRAKANRPEPPDEPVPPPEPPEAPAEAEGRESPGM